MVEDALDVLSFIIGESSGKWQNENLTVIFKTSFYFKMKTMANSAGLEINKK